MKGTFNGICSICKRFRPRCADMTEPRKPCTAQDAPPRIFVVCQECREAPENAGKFRAEEKHR
jgi:hypothetical protein